MVFSLFKRGVVMQWVKIKDEYDGEQYWNKRPYIKHPIDDENQTEYPKRIACLCKWNKDYLKVHYGDGADLLYNQIDKLWYDCDLDAWFGDEDTYLFDFESDNLDSYILLDELNDILDGKPESLWCWEFGSTLANTAIPALEKWIDKGVSYVYSMSPEEWRDILQKILEAFKICKSDLDGDLDDLPIEERNRLFEEHKQLRKEAFALMAEYYLDLWD